MRSSALLKFGSPITSCGIPLYVLKMGTQHSMWAEDQKQVYQLEWPYKNTQRRRLGAHRSLKAICRRDFQNFLECYIYICMSGPSLHRQSTDSLIELVQCFNLIISIGVGYAYKYICMLICILNIICRRSRTACTLIPSPYCSNSTHKIFHPGYSNCDFVCMALGFIVSHLHFSFQ